MLMLQVLQPPFKFGILANRPQNKKNTNYRKVVSSNTSCLEANKGFFRLLMKGIFDPYVL